MPKFISFHRWIALTHKGGPVRQKTPWWRHQMEIFSALLAICAGNSPVPVNSPHKGQWRGALMFTLICVRINGWVNNRETDDLRRNRGHYGVIVMPPMLFLLTFRVKIYSHIKVWKTPTTIVRIPDFSLMYTTPAGMLIFFSLPRLIPYQSHAI